MNCLNIAGIFIHIFKGSKLTGKLTDQQFQSIYETCFFAISWQMASFKVLNFCVITFHYNFSLISYVAQRNVNASKKTPSFGIIRDSKNLTEMVKATIWYILKRGECTGNLSNTKRPSWRTTLHHLTKSKTLSRRFCIAVKAYNQETCSWMEIQGFTTRCKALFTFQNRKIRFDFAKKPLKEPALCWKKKITQPDENKMNL